MDATSEFTYSASNKTSNSASTSTSDAIIHSFIHASYAMLILLYSPSSTYHFASLLVVNSLKISTFFSNAFSHSSNCACTFASSVPNLV